MRRICLVVFGIVAAFALAAPPSGAQASDRAPATVGPTMQSASLSPQLSIASPHDQDAVSEASYALTNGQKLMILGGVTLIAGAIIGGTPGTIIMIGGAGVGIYGLYLQLGYTKKSTEIGYKLTF